jgi:sulfur carrier protein ThiS
VKLTFKAYAMLADYLPDSARNNALDVDAPEGTTIADLIERFRLPVRLCHLVLVDGRFVPAAERAGRVLHEGETLAIWPPIAGG